MASHKIDELKEDVAELNAFLISATRLKVKSILSIEIHNLQTEISNLSEKTTQSNSVLTNATKPKCYEVKLNNYAWDQSDKFVKIFVSLKNVQTLEASNIFCLFTNRSLELNVKGLDNRNYQLPIKNLLEEIDTDKSYWKVKTDNVVVFLAKKQVGSKWSHMTGAEKKVQDSKMPKMEPGGDPSAGLMDLMKKMYDDGDDDMKRTIAKAWTESREKQLSGDPPAF